MSMLAANEFDIVQILNLTIVATIELNQSRKCLFDSMPFCFGFLDMKLSSSKKGNVVNQVYDLFDVNMSSSKKKKKLSIRFITSV